MITCRPFSTWASVVNDFILVTVSEVSNCLHTVTVWESADGKLSSEHISNLWANFITEHLHRYLWAKPLIEGFNAGFFFCFLSFFFCTVSNFTHSRHTNTHKHTHTHTPSLPFRERLSQACSRMETSRHPTVKHRRTVGISNSEPVGVDVVPCNIQH